MVNPMLTVLFDLFLVGSAIMIIAAMVDEYFSSQKPAIGRKGGHALPPAHAAPPIEQRRRALRKVA